MTRRDRVIIEILGPAPLGLAGLVLARPLELGRTFWERPFEVPIYLAFAYAFALVPSGLYAWLVEWSLRRNWWRRAGRLGFVGYSTALGAAAGVAIWRASEAPVVGVGALVGLILGVVLADSVRPDRATPGRLSSGSTA